MWQLLPGTKERLFMTKIKDAFSNGTAFISYIMAGDPNLQKSAEYILAAQDAGASLVEIGIPFSDPIAEGEIIQAASIRAINAGARLDGVLDMAESIKDRVKIPLVFMTYLNPVFVYGYDRFFSRCRDIGICGIIIPDMPYEEQGEAKEYASKYGVEIITLIAPTSAKRIERLSENAEGFIYLVSSMGVTGVRSEIRADLSSIVSEIRKYTDIPISVGFGISTPEQAREYSKMADGVIVGSAIVKIIGEHGENAEKPLFDYIKTMKESL